jgi:hypothetical protein
MDRVEYINLLNSLIDSKTKEELNANIRIANEFIRNNSLYPETPEFKKIDTVVSLMKVKLKNKRKMEFESIQENVLFELKKKELVSIIKESDDYTNVVDYTKAAQRILQVLIPKKVKYIEGVEVLKCFTADEEHSLGGGYLRYVDKIIYIDLKYEISKEPLIRKGFDPDSEITIEIRDEAYGKNYFENLRDETHKFAPYLSIETAGVNWRGTINFKLV